MKESKSNICFQCEEQEELLPDNTICVYCDELNRKNDFLSGNIEINKNIEFKNEYFLPVTIDSESWKPSYHIFPDSTKDGNLYVWLTEKENNELQPEDNNKGNLKSQFKSML